MGPPVTWQLWGLPSSLWPPHRGQRVAAPLPRVSGLVSASSTIQCPLGAWGLKGGESRLRHPVSLGCAGSQGWKVPSPSSSVPWVCEVSGVMGPSSVAQRPSGGGGGSQLRCPASLGCVKSPGWWVPAPSLSVPWGRKGVPSLLPSVSWLGGGCQVPSLSLSVPLLGRSQLSHCNPAPSRVGPDRATVVQLPSWAGGAPCP